MKMTVTIKTVIIALSVALAGLVGVAGYMTLNAPVEETTPTETTQPPTTEPTTVPTEPVETTEPAPTEPDPKHLELLAMNEQNEDIDCWLVIDDTVIDYPVAYTPDEPEKYDRLSVEGTYSYYGTLYIGKQCSFEPESENLIIYGHNLENGKMFSDLNLYKDVEYWEEHPLIKFYTLEGGRTYKIMAAFYDRIYYSYEDVFKFYKFVNAEDEEDFNNAMAAYAEKALYDTGVEAEYGDRLLTLITCSYHHTYGRFVVVAVEMDAEELAALQQAEAELAMDPTEPTA